MKICIIGGGAGARSASRGIRQLNNDIQIDLFTAQNEIDYAPCEPPFVLRGSLEWKDIFYSGNFYEKNNICVHLKSRVTNIDRKNNYIMVGDKAYHYDKLVLATGAIPFIPSIHVHNKNFDKKVDRIKNLGVVFGRKMYFYYP